MSKVKTSAVLAAQYEDMRANPKKWFFHFAKEHDVEFIRGDNTDGDEGPEDLLNTELDFLEGCMDFSKPKIEYDPIDRSIFDISNF